MRTWVRKSLSVGVLAAAALLFAPGAAQADAWQGNGDNNGIFNGTQLVAPVNVPVNFVGNALGLAGEASAGGAGVNRTESGWAGQSNGDNNGIANGSQAYLPVSVPLNIVGNGLAVLGATQSSGVGANSVGGRRAESAHTTEGGWGGNNGWDNGWGGGGQSNGNNNGIANGTQVYAPVDIPVNICGNSLAILGGASASAICGNNINRRSQESAKVTESGWQSNGDNNGILNGTQLYAPISLPLNLAGNSAALLGSAQSQALAGNRVTESTRPGWGGQSNGHNNGFLNGTQFAAPISVPLNFCGNALGILGAAHAGAGCSNHIGNDFSGFRRLRGDRDNRGWIIGDQGLGHGHGQGPFILGDDDDDDFYLGDDDVKGVKGGYGNVKDTKGGYGNVKDTKGHKGNKGHKGGNVKGDKDGYGNVKDDKTGYGADAPVDEEPVAEEPVAEEPATGYGDVSPAATGSDSAAKPGRGRTAKTESLPVTSVTDVVSGLGLLNTLR